LIAKKVKKEVREIKKVLQEFDLEDSKAIYVDGIYITLKDYPLSNNHDHFLG
jgi:hypothetical protein